MDPFLYKVMLVAIGMLVAVPIVGYGIRRLIVARFPFRSTNPIEVEIAGQKVLYRHIPAVRSKHSELRPPAVEILLASHSGGTFSLAPEEDLDGKIKRWGLTEEARTVGGDFDNRFFVFAPDDRAFRSLLENSVFQQQLSQLYENGVREFHHDGDHLRIRWSPFREKLVEENLKFVVESLAVARAMATQVGQSLRSSNRKESMAAWRSRMAWIEGHRIGCFLLAGVMGVIGVIFSWFMFTPLDFWQGVGAAAQGAAVGLGVGFWWGRKISRDNMLPGQQTVNVVAASCLLGGCLGNVSVICGNGYGDTGPTVEYRLPILSHRIQEDKKTRYLVTVPHWKRAGEKVTYQVSYFQYQRLVPGCSGVMVLESKPGRLGVAWVASKTVEVSERLPAQN